MRILPGVSGRTASTPPHGGAEASASTRTGLSATGPLSGLASLSSHARSTRTDAPVAGRNARLPGPLRAGPSHDPRTEEPHVLPPADRLDAEIWTPLPAAMERFAVARTRQGLAMTWSALSVSPHDQTTSESSPRPVVSRFSRFVAPAPVPW